MRVRSLLLLLPAVLLLTGCGLDDPASTEAGFGLATLSADEAAAAADSAGSSFSYREGRLAVAANGCLHWASDDELDGSWMVWPDGYAEDGSGVIPADGVRVGEGGRITGTSAPVALADLPEGADPDSYFGSFGRYCGADEAGVLVLASFEG